MEISDLKQTTAKGLFWGSISNGSQQIISVAFGIVLARILNKEDYGLIGILSIFSEIASTIINSGFSIALTNKKNAGHKDYNAVFWFTVLSGLCLYVILFFSAPLIANFFQRQELINLSRFLFLNFLIEGIGTTSHTIMYKRMMTKSSAIIDILSMLAALSAGVILAIKGLAYWALAVQIVIHITLSTILRFIVAPWKPTFQIDFSPVKSLIPFSFKLFLTSIFSQINDNVFSLIFGKFYNAGQVGVYNQGQKWAEMGNQFIGGMIDFIIQPVLVQVNENKHRQAQVLRKLIRFGAFISFPLMLGLAFISQEFILITIGEKWLPSVPFLQLFCIWMAFRFLDTLYVNLIFTHGKSDWFLYGTVVTGLLQLVVIVCIYPFGIFPMITAYLSICFVSLGIWQYYVSRLVPLQIRDVLNDILPYLGISLGCFAIILPITRNITNLYLLLTVKIIIGSLLYVLILKIGKSVMLEEIIGYISNIIKNRHT